MNEIKICPKCGKHFYGVPAISRVDYSSICPGCGILDAVSVYFSRAKEDKDVDEDDV